VATPIVSCALPSVEPAAKPHASVYEIITSRIVEELEKGQVPWRKPWRTLPPANLVSKKAYRGINVFLLENRTEIQTYQAHAFVALQPPSSNRYKRDKPQCSRSVVSLRPEPWRSINPFARRLGTH
jgi:hypothetical protein